MDKKRRLFLITAFIFLSAALGYHSGTLAKSSKKPYSQSDNTFYGSSYQILPSAIVEAPEVIVLFVLGQKEDTARFSLKGIWYAVVKPSLGGVYWFPLFPQQGMVSEENNLLIERKFQLQPNQELELSFIHTLEDVAQTHWDKAVFLETADFIDIVDSLGGLSLDGEWLNGKQAVEKEMQAAETNHKEIITNQATLLQAICKRRDEVRNQPQLLNSVAQRLIQRWSSSEKDSKADHALEVFMHFMLQANSIPCEFIGV